MGAWGRRGLEVEAGRWQVTGTQDRPMPGWNWFAAAAAKRPKHHLLPRMAPTRNICMSRRASLKDKRIHQTNAIQQHTGKSTGPVWDRSRNDQVASLHASAYDGCPVKICTIIIINGNSHTRSRIEKAVLPTSYLLSHPALDHSLYLLTRTHHCDKRSS